MDNWVEVLVGVAIVALVVIIIWAGIYTTQHCLKYETGPGMSCHTYGDPKYGTHTTCSPDRRCVQWDDDR